MSDLNSMRPWTVHVVDDRDKHTRGDIRPDASGSTINDERGNVMAKKTGAFVKLLQMRRRTR